jgi:beta-lactamase regulating signal transducer with metallopeptidase domain
MQYLIESAICLSLLYGFYALVLRKETFFQLNRFYLLVAPVLSILIPLLNIPLSKPSVNASGTATEPAVESWPVMVVEQMESVPKEVQVLLNEHLWQLSYETILWSIYLIGVAFVLLRLMVQLFAMQRFLSKCRTKEALGVVLASHTTDTPVASFFGFVFWNPEHSTMPNAQLIFEHEMVHVREWHTLDLILMELLIAFQWFNPFLYLYKNSIREVHEYIADDHVVRRTRQHYEYARLLVSHQLTGNGAQPGLVNTFHSLIKKRLIMLAKHPSGPINRIKYVLVLPLFLGLLLLFSFRLVERIPHVAPILDAVGEYESSLSELVISSDKLDAAQSPYILYWGLFEAHFEKSPQGNNWVAEVHLSPEEFAKSVHREPRLWNGETLLQQTSFKMESFSVSSDYYKPEVYENVKTSIESWASGLKQGDRVTLRSIYLAPGVEGTVRLILDNERPNSLNKPVIAGNSSALENIKTVRFADWNYDVLGTHFISKETLFERTNGSSAPYLIYADGKESRSPKKWSLSIYGPNGEPVLRSKISAEYAQTWDEVVQTLDSKKQEIESGCTVSIGAWDILPKETGVTYDTIVTFDPATGTESVQVVTGRPATQVDTVYTFDPETKESKVVVVENKPAGPRAMLFGNTLLQFRIVQEKDPRLTLDRDKRRNFAFQWGSMKASFPNQYGITFESEQGKVTRHADGPLEVRNHMFTKTQILEFMKEVPNLYADGEALPEMNFTLNYSGNGQSVAIKNGEVPADVLQLLERNLQPGEKITLTGFQAWTDAPRSLVCSKAVLETLPEKKIQATTSYFTDSFKSDPSAQVRFDMTPDYFKTYKKTCWDYSGVWFQYGDISLPNAVIELEVRSEDPKPPLKGGKKALVDQMELTVLPNPAQANTRVRMNLPQAGKGSLSLSDMSGKQLIVLQTDFSKGETSIPISNHLPDVPGMYLIILEMPYGKAVQSFIVE